MPITPRRPAKKTPAEKNRLLNEYKQNKKDFNKQVMDFEDLGIDPFDSTETHMAGAFRTGQIQLHADRQKLIKMKIIRQAQKRRK